MMHLPSPCLPTLLELGLQKARGSHHQYEHEKSSIKNGRTIRFCLCGRSETSRIHFPPLPKVERPKPWIANVVKVLTGDEVQEFLEKNKEHRRFKVFYHKGPKCVLCDRVGVKIIGYLDNPNDPRSHHYDLFTEDDVMMTVDHKLPKYHGGTDALENLQPMCGPHNWEKGSKIDYEETLQKEA